MRQDIAPSTYGNKIPEADATVLAAANHVLVIGREPAIYFKFIVDVAREPSGMGPMRNDTATYQRL